MSKKDFKNRFFINARLGDNDISNLYTYSA